MVDWANLHDLYDEVDRKRALRARGAPGSSATKTKEWSSKWIEYSVNQINSVWLASTWQGTTNLNISCSDQHIANIVLVQYKHLIHPFKTPFKSSEFIPEAVWQAMVQKVVECKEYHALWIATEREEFWNRPLEMYMERPVLVGLTGSIMSDATCGPVASMEVIHKGTKRVPVLRIQLGVK